MYTEWQQKLHIFIFEYFIYFQNMSVWTFDTKMFVRHWPNFCKVHQTFTYRVRVNSNILCTYVKSLWLNEYQTFLPDAVFQNNEITRKLVFFYFQKRATYHLAQQKPVFRKFKLKKVLGQCLGMKSLYWQMYQCKSV